MSLRSRIVLTVTAVFAVVSGLAGWLMLNRAETSLETAFDRATRTRANWLLSLISVDPIVIPLPTAAERMRVVYETDEQTRELFRSPRFPDARPFSDPRPGPPDGPHRKGHRPYRPGQTYRVVTTESLSEQTDGRLTLMLGVPDASLRADTAQLRWGFGLGWLLSLVLAFTAGYGLAGWLLLPIQRIVNQADTITNAATIDPIVLPDTRDELYHLTDTLNRMLARIRESVELQRNFFGAAAHELRTPLTVMKTGLEVTLNSRQTNESTAPFLRGQLDEVSRLTRLLDEFLTLSRPDDLAQPLKIVPVNLPDLIRHCLVQLATVASDYDVTTTFNSTTPPDSTLLTDATKLEHVLLNLVENAVKYAVPGSVVRIGLRQSRGYSIEVQNQTLRESGPTLDLMQPYFRADPLKEGHGLGLWISYRLTTLLGGQLRLSWHDSLFTSELMLPGD